MESQFHADELHVGVDMAGGNYSPVPRKIFILGALESVFQCNLTDQLKNSSHGGGTFIYLSIHLLYFLS